MENGASISACNQSVNVEAVSKQKPQRITGGTTGAQMAKSIPEDLVEFESSTVDTQKSEDSASPNSPQTRRAKENRNKKEKEVTFLFYMDGQYPDLESTMASIPIGLETVGSNNDMNIIMQLGRAQQDQVYPEGGYDRIDNDWAGVRRYYIQKQNFPRKGSVTLGDWIDVSREYPNNPLIHYVLGEVYESQGMKEEAEKEFSKAESLGYMKFFIEPFNPKVKDWSREFQTALQPLRDKDAAINLYESPITQNLGTGVDMKHPQNLKDFVAWGIKNYPARHYVVVMGGHGGAWTGALQMSPSDIGMAIQAGIHQANRQTGRTDGVDVLVFNSCYMANLESLNEMKDAADVIVASEMSAKSSVLKDWPELLAHVQRDIEGGKSFDAKEFAKDIVGYYQEKGNEIKDLPLMKKFSKEHYLTLSAVDTSKIVDIVNAWREFLNDWDQLGVADSEIFNAIEQSKNYPSFAYTPEMLFDFGTLRDLGDIARRIADSEKLPPKIREDALNIKKALEEAIIAEQHTGHDMDKSSGLTLWAPTNVSDIALMTAPYGKRVPDFVQQTNWDKKLAGVVNEVDPQQLGKFMKCIRLLAQIQQSLKTEMLTPKEIQALEEKQKLLKSEVIRLREGLKIIKPAGKEKEQLDFAFIPVSAGEEHEDKAMVKEEEYIEKSIKSSQKHDGMSHGKGLYFNEKTELDQQLIEDFTEEILKDSQLFNGMGYMPNM